MIKSPRARVLLVCTVAIASLATLVWVLQRRSGYYATNAIEIQNQHGSTFAVRNASAEPGVTLAPKLNVLTPATSPRLPVSDSGPAPLPVGSQQSLSLPLGFVGTLKLIIPVAGVRPDQLQDTFKDVRSEERVHDALDIPAPLGTPVIAAADGEIIKLFQSERGGITIYQFSADKKLVFYYAHLQRHADGLFPGKFTRQAEVIAYVGDTGNAGAGNYHLHFSISVIADPKRYWEGTNINPYPLLRR